MRGRAFNKRVEIWQTTSVSDGFGGNINTEALLNTSWAKVETVSTKNRNALNTEFGLLDASNSVIITTRQRNDLTYDLQTMFVKYRGEKYIIKSYPTNKDFKDNTITFIATKEYN